MMRTISVVLIFANACFLVGASTFLQSNSKSLEAKARLRERASQLAAALRSSLGYGSADFPVLVVAARNRLGDEADQLGYSDPSQAYLLREYARRAPPAILVEPTAFFVAPEYEPQKRMMSSSVSEESVFHSDGQGNAVVRTTHCKDGDCVEQVQHGKQLPADAELSSSGSTLAGNDHEASISGAVTQMAHEMQQIQDAFGHDGLDDMLNDVFAAPVTSPDPLDSLMASGQTNGTDTQSWSTSTQTQVVNGQIVQKKQECKNGKCITKVVQAHTPPQGQASGVSEDSMVPQDRYGNDSEDSMVPGRVGWSDAVDADQI